MSIFNKNSNETKKEKQTKTTEHKIGWTREKLLSLKDFGCTGSLLHDTAPDAEMENCGYEREA